MFLYRAFQATLASLMVLGVAATAHAQRVAVFGNNGTDDFINTLPGFTAVLVTDGQLATANFLTDNDFDAFYYTRDDSSFGTSLSLAAAANVSAFVGATGNVVLFNGDFADEVGADAERQQLTANAVSFATQSGNGYIGEFTGAAAALTANSNGLQPLNLIAGSAGALGFGEGGSGSTILQAPAGAGNPVLTGISFPFSPPDVAFGSTFTGVAPANVLATYSGGAASPAILSRGFVAVPEPGTVTLAAGALILGGLILRRRKTA